MDQLPDRTAVVSLLREEALKIALIVATRFVGSAVLKESLQRLRIAHEEPKTVSIGIFFSRRFPQFPKSKNCPHQSLRRCLETSRAKTVLGGKGPIEAVAAEDYPATMYLLVLILVLLLLFGGGGFYFGGPAIGGGGLGLVLLICLVIFFMGGFRRRN